MARYIDADVLIEVLERSAKDPRNEKAMTSWANAFEELTDLLEETLIPMSTADVQPVVKGEWNYKGLDFDIDSLYQCSVCEHFHWAKSNYCPNCGARMVEE